MGHGPMGPSLRTPQVILQAGPWAHGPWAHGAMGPETANTPFVISRRWVRHLRPLRRASGNASMDAGGNASGSASNEQLLLSRERVTLRLAVPTLRRVVRDTGCPLSAVKQTSLAPAVHKSTRPNRPLLPAVL